MSTLKNSGWIIADKILRAGSGLIITSILAKKIGTDLFGIYNIALTFFAFAGPFSTLGLDSISIKEFVNIEKSKEGELIGTLLLMRALASFLCILILGCIVYWIYPVSIFLVAIIQSVLLIPISIDIFEFYFQAKHQSNKSFKARNIAFLIFLIPKLAFIYLTKCDLYIFITISIVEACLSTFLLFYFYQIDKKVSLSFSKSRAMNLLKSSWPLIFSSLAIIIYMRTDQLMLAEMIDYKVVGIYSAALKISEAWYFVPIALLSSFYPKIVNFINENDSINENKYMNSSLIISSFISIVVSVFFLLFGHIIINLLFGLKYIESVNILNIHIWTGLFICWGIASNQILTAKNINKKILFRTIIGAIINFILNLILIPKLQGVGAAIATLISQIYVGFIADMFDKNTRHLVALKIQSLQIWKLKEAYLVIKQ